MHFLAKILLVYISSFALATLASDLEDENTKSQRLLNLNVSAASVSAIKERTNYILANSDRITNCVSIMLDQYDRLTDRMGTKRRNEQILSLRQQTANFLYTKVGRDADAFLFLLQQMHAEANDRLHLSDLFSNPTISLALAQASPGFFLKIAHIESRESALFALFVVSELTIRGNFPNKDAIKIEASNIFSKKYDTFANELSYRLMADPQVLLLTAFNLQDTLFKHKLWKSPLLYAINKLTNNAEIANHVIRKIAHVSFERDLDFLWSFTDSLRHAAALRPTDNSGFLAEYHSDLYDLINFAEHTITIIGRSYPNDSQIRRCIYSFYAVRAFIMFRNHRALEDPDQDDNLEVFRKQFGQIGSIMSNSGIWIEHFAPYENFGLILRHVHSAMFSPAQAVVEYDALKKLATWDTHRQRCQSTFTVEPEHFNF